MATLSNLLQIIAPKKKAKKQGTAITPTHNPSSPQNPLPVPQYRDHLTDVFNSRLTEDSRALVKQLALHDPDFSAAINSYLTLANTAPVIVARDLEGVIDREATKQVRQILNGLTRRIDYTLGFQLKPSLETLCENLRFMLLMRGGIGCELVMNEKMMPSEIRVVDLTSVEWREQKPGEYKPFQKPPGQNTELSLDIPSFFVSFFRRDPTSIYSYSPFVSAVNTIAARQQVINDLYRIMRITGYPRIDLKVIEEVVLKNAPADVRADGAKQVQYLQERMQEIANNFATIRADQAFVHFDSVEATTMNDKKPGAGIDISGVIETLNAQNQAALKTMATVIGRGNSGVNTASVEARIAAMNADELNAPISEILSGLLSLAMHLQGFQGFVEVRFRKVEMRPELELEPQRVMRQSRLQNDLSLGLISDDDYHLEMYGRVKPDAAPELSGTGFMNAPAVGVDENKVSPNGDPLGRSLAPEGSASARSNTVKKPGGSRAAK